MDDLTDFTATFVDAIGDRPGKTGKVATQVGAIRQAWIADAAGARDDRDTEYETRPRDQALLDCRLESGIESPGISHRRDPGFERDAKVVGHLHHREAERRRQARGAVEAGVTHMIVRVDHAGHDRLSGHI